MNPMQNLVQIVRTCYPDINCAVDPAENDLGSWFLDLRWDGYWLNIEWHPKRGFGLIARDDVVFGEGADEVYPDPNAAVRRVLWLLERKSSTSPPLADAGAT